MKRSGTPVVFGICDPGPIRRKVPGNSVWIFRLNTEDLRSWLRVAPLQTRFPSWGGWLGRYNAKLQIEVKALEGMTQRRGQYPLEGFGRK